MTNTWAVGASPALARLVARLVPGSHASLIYRDPGEQLALVAPFLAGALARHEQALYVCEDDAAADTVDVLKAAGAIPPCREPGAFAMVGASEACLRAGRLHGGATVAFLGERIERAVAGGFSGLAVVADMSWALAGAHHRRRLASWEGDLDAFVHGSGVAVLSLYARARLDRATLFDLLRHVPVLVVGSHVIDSHPEYELPASAAVAEPRSGIDEVIEDLVEAAERADRAKRNTASGDVADAGTRTMALEASVRDLESFTYAVSHDLRAPLRGVQGFARILVEEYRSELPPEAKRYLALIDEGAIRIGTLIDDLVGFSRVARQAVRRVRVPLADLVASAIDQLSRENAGRAMDLHVDDLPECEGDPAMLRQAVVHLLSNAFKFTRGRDPARIEVGWVPALSSPRECVYFVKDNGVGFDMQYVGKLFSIFQRLHPADEFEGTGIGLAIVQRVVERHGGRVWCDAGVDRGATFYFALPRPNVPAR